MSDATPALRDHLALALVPGLGPKLTAAVIRHFGSPAAALHASAAQLRTVPQIGEKLADAFTAAFRTVDVDAELRLMETHGVRPVPLGGDGYPAVLAGIDDPPPLLYFRGETTPGDADAVAMVGSRSCTPYGRRVAERLAAGLARAGWTVVSGLARGIDGAAHRGALDAGGRTIAVLAGGLSRIYPPEHADLATEIARQGYLVSETPLTVAPQPGMFPARNRIISGLSRAVIVVEAGDRSGALITVEHAAEQGRDVFAVPGPVDSPASAGCLDLLRKGAKLVRSAEDVLEDLRGIAAPEPPVQASGPRERARGHLFEPQIPLAAGSTRPPENLEPLQQQIWDALDSPRHFDELSRATARSVSELTGGLIGLELKKLVRRLPGNRYERR
jgi:DNA processing protein